MNDSDIACAVGEWKLGEEGRGRVRMNLNMGRVDLNI